MLGLSSLHACLALQAPLSHSSACLRLIVKMHVLFPPFNSIWTDPSSSNFHNPSLSVFEGVQK